MPKSYKLYKIQGTIKHCWLGQVASKGPYQNQSFYYLIIQQDNLFSGKKEISIYVFPNLVSKEIWNTLTQQTYQGKTYHFYCEKRVRGWRLIKWELILVS